jgi:hypothetical protein
MDSFGAGIWHKVEALLDIERGTNNEGPEDHKKRHTLKSSAQEL